MITLIILSACKKIDSFFCRGRFYHADILTFGEAISITSIAFINLITPNLPFMESIYYLPIEPLSTTLSFS